MAMAPARHEQTELSKQEEQQERGKEAEALKAQVDGCGEAGASASAEAGARRVETRAPRLCDDGSETE
jgi:hypothetical protein